MEEHHDDVVTEAISVPIAERLPQAPYELRESIPAISSLIPVRPLQAPQAPCELRENIPTPVWPLQAPQAPCKLRESIPATSPIPVRPSQAACELQESIPTPVWALQAPQAPCELRENIPATSPIPVRSSQAPCELQESIPTPVWALQVPQAPCELRESIPAPSSILVRPSQAPCELQESIPIPVRPLQAPCELREGLQAPRELQEGGSFRPQMQKIPPKLRQENNQQVYDPLVVSFGPYHHGKVELQLAEEFKPKALEKIVKDSRKGEHLFYKEVLEDIKGARSCYVDGSTNQYDDQTFARMMLLDASFIINYILLPQNQIVLQNNIMLNYLGKWGFGQVIRDMLLLENQIPFFILKRLTCLAYGENKGEEMLNKFLNRNTFLSHKHSGIASSESENPLHLLAAYRLTFLSEQAEVVKESLPPRYALGECLNKFWCSTRRKQEKDDDNDENDKYVERSFIQSFRSVTDLKAKGIHFRPSNVDSLQSFEFKSGYLSAQLKVPVTIVSVNTKVIFSNLIAYEMSAKTEIGIAVITYIEFMKSLIDKPEDVKELREKNILLSYLSSDEDVVKVYKEIGPCGLYYSKRFNDVKEEIQEHYNNKVKTWLAELIHTYFRNPWTAAALLAATFLLVLTLLQTYYTIKPSP